MLSKSDTGAWQRASALVSFEPVAAPAAVGHEGHTHLVGALHFLLQTTLQETKSETMDVMTILDGQSSPMTGNFEVSVWETLIKNDWAASPENSATIKNVVTVSAAIQRL